MDSNDDKCAAWKKKVSRIKYVAAPMVDMSKLPFRMLCRKYNSQLCCTPMFHASLFTTDAVYREDVFTTCDEDRPLVVQFCANNPETFVKAAKLVENKCDAVDLNLGCPQIIAKKGHYGAYLQDEWDLISNIVQSAVKQLSIPVTCKIRILPGPDEKTVEYAKMLERSGCAMLTVHGRTRDQRGKGLANWNVLKKVKQSLSIPVFANGNVLSFEDVQVCLEYTGVDGVMSAEGILHNPALFSGTNPYVWDISEEFLSLCEKYPIQPRHVRTHLFRLWQYCLEYYKDLRQKLAESNTIFQYEQISKELRERLDPSISRDATLTVKEFESSTAASNEDVILSTNKEEKNYHQPLYLAHSRPRNLPSLQSTQTDDDIHCDISQQQQGIKRCSDDDGEQISKNVKRKLDRYDRIVASRKERRKEKKQRRKERIALARKLDSNRSLQTDQEKSSVSDSAVVKITKKEMKMKINERMLMARCSAPIICIDLAYCECMSQKEQGKLITQLCRLYGSNRKSSSPFHLYFTNISKDSSFYNLCCKKNEGFESYIINMEDKSPSELFDPSKIIQLSPDASTALELISNEYIYVLGGIVDETVNKNLSVAKAESYGSTTARLPINEFLTRADKGTFSKILTANQVFDILLKFYETNDWTESLLHGIPKRNGFKPKSPP